MIEPRSRLYALEAFGIRGPWFAWKVERGGLDEFCPECRGEGIVIASPCLNRPPRPRYIEAMASPPEPCPGREAGGCAYCRRRCGVCRGRRLTRPPELLDEDFLDPTDLELAERMFPGLEVRHGAKRSDLEAQLG